MSREVAFRPHPKQLDFLSAAQFEVLYGGAAGGGKSIGLVIDALGLNHRRADGSKYNAIEHPKYRALLLRKHYTDLKEIIDYGLEYYPKLVPGCEFRSGARQFVFPSGARIELGHVQNVGDEERYKSRAFQYIGWEELTEHASPRAYEYLLSRCRGPEELFKCIRATTNPDGPGNAWVKARWRIPDSGESVPAFTETVETRDGPVTFSRRFIRARVEDNPSNDKLYEARLGLLSEQKRRALRDGRWDIIDLQGSIYGVQYQSALVEGRITSVPHVTGHPVNTFWDLGSNDANAIWFHQYVGLQDRFIDYYENRHQPLSHYIQEMQKRGYVWGRHFLPHDAEHRRLGATDNRSIREMLEELGLRNLEVVPRIDIIKNGIEQTRQRFSSAWFDENRCEVGLDCLKFYRWKYNARTGVPQQEPVHDWTSNGADAFRQWAQGFDPSARTWDQLKADHANHGSGENFGSGRRRATRSSLISPDTGWVV